LDSRGLIERAKRALMERERLDDQEAFTHLRRAARSSGRKLTEVAREVAAGQPLPRIRTRTSRTRPEQADGEADTP
jgi:AmiR/NasT family two-component response regulator